MDELEKYNLKEIDLEKIIEEMSPLFFDNKVFIYLFGSRAYQTNSTRSDIDLIIFSEKPLNENKLKIFMNSHKYLDFFVGNEEYIHSLVNDSSISLRGGFNSLIQQLDAVLLWDSVNGFCENNFSFLFQTIKGNVKWHPSSFSGIDPIISIKKFVKNYFSQINDRQLAFLNEGIECYENENWLAFISMIGAYLETLILDLIVTYELRVNVKINSLLPDYHLNIGDIGLNIGVKSRMERFVAFITTNDANFGKLYLKNKAHVTFIETTFDIARRFRNNVDHCLEYQYDEDTCSSIILLFNGNVQTVVDAISLLRSNPGL